MDSIIRKRLETAVLAAMEAAGREVMVWGKDDCALWPANIISETLGYDPAAPYRGRYTTRAGSRRVLGKSGLKGALRSAARRHKWKTIDPVHALPGDVGLAWTMIDVPGRASVPVIATVICRSHGWFVGRNEKGYTAIRPDRVAVCWSLLNDNQAGARVTLRQYSISLVRPPTSVPQEPISFTVAFIATTFSVSTATATFILTTALSIGFSLVSSLLQPHKGLGQLDANLANTSQVASVQVTERQPIPFKRVIVGSAYVGGAIFFEKVTPPYLTVGTLFHDGESSGVDKIFISTNELSFASLVPNAILSPIAVVGQPNYPSRLRVSVRYGATTQAIDPLIAARYPSINTEFRQRGISTLVAEYHFGANQDEFLALWGQVSRPNAYIVARGAPVYDPRDATQDLNNTSTWQWSNNASLVQAWYLTRAFGGRIPVSKIDWDKVADAANYDDELIGCADGTFIKRHTIDGVITLNQRPFEVLQKLLTANRGSVLESGGHVWVSSSRPKTPIVTIHDGMLTTGIKYQSAKAKRELINKLQVRFVAPDQDYQMVDGPVLSRTDLQTTDNEILTGTIALEYTQDHRRAQRLQKAFLLSSRLGRTLTLTVDPSILGVTSDELIGNVVTFNSQLFPSANGNYEVTSVSFSEDCSSISLALREYDPSIETNWNYNTDEKPFELAVID